ncbi:hypothetical protein KC19_2G282800 [Ceratodon purpureus]|uniref:Transmembrane protein n=1 Tax=Ceratodon purpureus TaxID=3225 RepID=A0A8T0J2Q2_CERPU|nr:hypothetical protein KC19_2G282800 [Ceratodon purpureus]
MSTYDFSGVCSLEVSISKQLDTILGQFFRASAFCCVCDGMLWFMLYFVVLDFGFSRTLIILLISRSESNLMFSLYSLFRSQWHLTLKTFCVGKGLIFCIWILGLLSCGLYVKSMAAMVIATIGEFQERGRSLGRLRSV